MRKYFSLIIFSTDAYENNLFLRTIRDWNHRHDSLNSSAELPDDCVSKFTSHVNFPHTQSLVKACYFGLSLVNYSDSDHILRS